VSCEAFLILISRKLRAPFCSNFAAPSDSSPSLKFRISPASSADSIWLVLCVPAKLMQAVYVGARRIQHCSNTNTFNAQESLNRLDFFDKGRRCPPHREKLASLLSLMCLMDGDCVEREMESLLYHVIYTVMEFWRREDYCT
jgi:hypothetical protein